MTPQAVAAGAVLAALLAAGCGYKGPLTLPEKTGPVIIRPATQPSAAQPPATPPATTQSPRSAPATPPAPAPEGTPTGG